MLETAASSPEQTRILIVDDERSVCQGLEKVLNRKGYRTNTALSASKALEILHANDDFDLIITDLMMPEVSGMELLKIARDTWPDIPVLIITGYASIASAVDATRLGATNYLAKPFTPEELQEAVTLSLSPKPDSLDTSPSIEDNLIDVDIPVNAREVEMATSESYVQHMTRSDTVIATPVEQPLDYCPKGSRNCKRYVKKGVCAEEICPVVAKESKKAEAQRHSDDPADMIDVDMPFSFGEVAGATSEAYARALGPSDFPVVGHWTDRVSGAVAKVLVVDDEVIVVNSVRRILSRKGYEVESAFTGREAWQRIQHQTYNLVLLDMRLPDVHGLQLLSRIRKFKPDLPVLVVTGYASIDTAVEAIQRGASDYMAKPFTPDELYTMTNRVLGRAAA